MQGNHIDVIIIKSLNFNSIRVIFTKVETSGSQNKAQIAYEIDTGSDGNLMSFLIFKTCFLVQQWNS